MPNLANLATLLLQQKTILVVGPFILVFETAVIGKTLADKLDGNILVPM